MPFIITPDNKVLGQSFAIMKYICREAGMFVVQLVLLAEWTEYYI